MSIDNVTTQASPFPGATVWARQAVGPYDDERLDAVAQDPQGNTIAAGIFTGTLNFGVGPLFNGDPGDYFVVVVKYAPDGRVLWNLPLRLTGIVLPPGEKFAEVGALATDPQGNILLTGRTASTFELGTVNLPPGFFLLQLSPNGSLLWARAVGSGTGTTASLAALATDDTGHIVLGGTLRGTLTFGTLTVSSPTANAPFLVKLAPDGTAQWAKVLSTRDRGSGFGVAVDSEHAVYLAGELGNTPFISRFSQSGQHLWTRRLAGARGAARSVATHGNRVVMTGTFEGSFSFRGQAHAADGKDAFLVACTRKGEQLWARNFGDSGVAVAMDGHDGVLVTGTYVNLDLGVGELHGSETLTNMFVARFSSIEGQPLWTRGFTNYEYEGKAYVLPTALSVTHEGEGAVVGLFGAGPINFGGIVLNPTGYPLHQEPFILRLAA